ncbi:hypothetical protein PRUPE_3G180700, partial [Prunus persica]
CYINDGWFQIICDNSTGNPTPFLNRTNLEVQEISVEEYTLRVRNPITFSNCSNKPISRQTANLEGTPFAYSQKNIFTAVGCGVMATITSNSNGYVISSGCSSECNISTNRSDTCEAALPSSLSDFSTSFQDYGNYRTQSSCHYAFLADSDWFGNNSPNFSAIREMDYVPVMLEWSLFHSTTDVYGTFFEPNLTTIYGSHQPYCRSYYDSSSINESSRLECSCRRGYKGNPYLLDGCQVNVEKIKLFNSKELETATDHYNVDRILGQGGQGTVYKGMLTDGRIVAVKKSKVVDGGEVAQLINEIVILSQINHRNVVKLLGCCLETEVPLLVYEFIPKGTIYQYLHQQNEEWQMRLRIVAEVAGALSYLHSAAGFPIYHRDIKSTNILLDEEYRAKVADFGTSRSVSIDQTHLTTHQHGTFGYLDPDYFQSNQFTDKSDVYSFGVVLVELLTGEKLVSLARSPEVRGLVAYFNFSMEENRLFDIVDAQVKEEGVTEDILAVATLAKRCLDLSGKRRPTMKEVAMALEWIQKSVKASKLQQNQEEVEYVRNELICDCPWDVASESTGSGFNGGTASSKDSLPLLS